MVETHIVYWILAGTTTVHALTLLVRAVRGLLRELGF